MHMNRGESVGCPTSCIAAKPQLLKAKAPNGCLPVAPHHDSARQHANRAATTSHVLHTTYRPVALVRDTLYLNLLPAHDDAASAGQPPPLLHWSAAGHPPTGRPRSVRTAACGPAHLGKGAEPYAGAELVAAKSPPRSRCRGGDKKKTGDEGGHKDGRWTAGGGRKRPTVQLPTGMEDRWGAAPTMPGVRRGPLHRWRPTRRHKPLLIPRRQRRLQKLLRQR